MAGKKITLEHLALMIGKGFEEATDNLNAFKEETAENFRLVNGKIDALEMEISQIKKLLNNIIYRHEYEALKDRVEKIERKLMLRR